MTHVLVVNTGSSSLKFQVVCADTGAWAARGLVERIGEDRAAASYEEAGSEPIRWSGELGDHAEALRLVLGWLDEHGHTADDLVAVGHRVVHGGPDLREPVVIDDDVESAIERVVPLAPLHNPAGLVGIRVLRRLLPSVPHVAVFDTAFHATMPPVAYAYAIDPGIAERYQVRRYGFHGTSFAYVTRRSAQFLGVRLDEVNLIVCHLGNGASMTAVRGGRSIDTSMGLTPLPGLVMGTRSGDIDPGVVFYLAREAGMAVDEIDRMLNHASGLLGLAGDRDMRAVRARADAGDRAARLALDLYAYRIRAYVGAYLAHVPGLHALVFTAGVGENDAALRREVCEPLAHLGFAVDPDRNAAAGTQPRAIDGDRPGCPRILVVPTNEEAEIARAAAEVAGRLG